MKRYICGILIICVFFAPFTGFAEEILNVPAGAASAAETTGTTTHDTPKVIINEIIIGSEVNPVKDVWVELYNPGAQEINLNGWEIKGVTSGGRWISISGNDLNIKNDGYLLISYYTNSKSSALNIKPDIQKSSLAFPNDSIEIELKDPNENIVDKVKINYEKLEEYKSYERNMPIGDGQLKDSWCRAAKQVNLKENLLKTFATPGGKNSCIENSVTESIGDKSDSTVPADTSTQPTEATIPNSDADNGVTDVAGTNILLPDNQTSITPVNTITNTQQSITVDQNPTTEQSSNSEPVINNRESTTQDRITNVPDTPQITQTTEATPAETSVQPAETTSINSDVTDDITSVGTGHVLSDTLQTGIVPVNTITDTQQPVTETQTLVTSDTSQTTQIAENTSTGSGMNDDVNIVGTGHALSDNEQINTAPAETTIQTTETTTTNPAPTTAAIANTTASSSSGTRNIEPISYPAYQLINEFMPNPHGSDTSGEWVELFNNTSVPIDLSGWYLDDAEGSSSPYKIKDNTVLGASSYIIFSAPDLDISLKNTDDQIRLLAPDKSAKEIISYFGAKEGYSYAKKPNGEFEWTSVTTYGTDNQPMRTLKSYHADDIIFKNVIPNPDGKDSGNEAITLKNNLGETIAMDDWKLKNEKGSEFNMAGISLNSYSTLAFNPADINLNLINASDQLSLIDPAGNLIDRINWSNAGSGKIIYKLDFFKDGMAAVVTKIIDGDTFAAIIGDEQFTIRLIGVDTPETVHPKKQIEGLGKGASEYLNGLLANQTVKLNFDDTKTDTYNRLLAYVYLGEKFINAEIIKNGYGCAYTKFPFKYQEDFVAYEKEAKTGNVGIWQNNVMSVSEILETQDTANVETKNDELLENDENMESDEKTDNPIVGDGHVRPTITPNTLLCQTTGLKIDSIMPNPDKTSVEYIKIINISSDSVCLEGWQLDDQIGQGSKPFKIKGGAIEIGAIRTFRKDETKIALNNSNDCANLINPLGDVADTICYSKTHENEIFTHDGGNWVSFVGNGQTQQKARSAAADRATQPTRPAENYQWDLKNETLKGKVAFVYDEGKVLYLQNNAKIIPISYANSKVDISMAKQMVNFGSDVSLDVHSTAESKQLIGIRQANEIKKEIIKNKNISKIPIEYIFIIFTGLSMVVLFYLYIKNRHYKLL